MMDESSPVHPDLSTEFVFDRWAISKELMKTEDGTKFAAPDSVVSRNIHTLHHWLEIWGYNMSLNAPLIMEDFGVDLHTRQATKLAGTEHASAQVLRPDLALIAGSGPSLEEYLPLMKNWPGYIICAPTNMVAFLAHGVVPHFCMAVDSSPVLGMHLKNAAEVPGASACKLLLPITADPEMARAWPFSRHWHLDFIQGGRGLNNPFNAFQVNIYPYVSFWLVQAGNVVNSAVMLPLTWGAQGTADIRKVFLFGVDCGFPGDPPQARISYYRYDATHKEFDVHPAASVEYSRSSPLVRSANGTLTEESQLGYKRSLLSVWQATFYRGEERVRGADDKEVVKILDYFPATRKPGMYHLYSCSKGVLEDTLPHEDGREVIESAGACARAYDRTEVNDRFRKYLKEIAPAENQADESGTEVT